MLNADTLRRRQPRRALATICAVVLPVLALSACGGDNVPGNAVAKVDDKLITKTTFDHWMQVAAISAQGSTQTGAAQPKPEIPQPPDYTACVAQKQKSAPKPAKGQPKPTAEDFKKQCKQEYEGLRDQV